ncbi:MAG: hypothetical protein VKL39_23425, partial [Leptolyngbyaceae bacterium]|nr:hypothetical protein [Leptolyngbyaceae bacterium]
MSVYLTSSNGALTITPNSLTNLPRCSEVPTENDQLVNKEYVDNNNLVINQIYLEDYINNLQGNSLNLDLSSNTINYLTNNISINSYEQLPELPNNLNTTGIFGGTVSALAFDNDGNLYAGGSFTVAGGITVNRIAKWDGSSWSALGSGVNIGVNNSVNALAFDNNGNLYAGGSFTVAGGITVNRIAKWDGSSWSA